MKLSKSMKAFGYLFFAIQLAFLQADDAYKISLNRQKDINAYIEDFPHFQEAFYFISDGTAFERQRALYNFIDDRLDDKEVNFGDVIGQAEDEIKEQMYPFFYKASFDASQISHPIIDYIMKYKDTKFQPVLREWLAKIQDQDEQKKTALHHAILSRSGSDSDSDSDSEPESESDNLVQFLLDVGVDVNMQDNYEKTALHYAILSKANNIVPLLIAAGADVNIQDVEGETALHHAVFNTGDIVSLLLAAGADVNMQDVEGDTALHWATAYQKHKIIPFLLEAGADINIQNNAGQTVEELVALDF